METVTVEVTQDHIDKANRIRIERKFGEIDPHQTFCPLEIALLDEGIFKEVHAGFSGVSSEDAQWDCDDEGSRITKEFTSRYDVSPGIVTLRKVLNK